MEDIDARRRSSGDLHGAAVLRVGKKGGEWCGRCRGWYCPFIGLRGKGKGWPRRWAV
jgi:hypothetical protein